jgi:hypothetical protein
MIHQARPLLVLVGAGLAVLLTLPGCAAITPAQMALPDALTTTVPEPVQGMGAGRVGEFTLGDARGGFQRAADQVVLFDTVTYDRATIRYRLLRADGSAVTAACRGRQATATMGIAMGQPRPYTLECQWIGAVVASLSLSGRPAGAGMSAERTGLFSTHSVTLELRSVHQVHGSSLPLNSAIGYVITHNGQPVGAIEVNGSTPRLWRPAAGSPLREPVTLAALAMALLWVPDM